MRWALGLPRFERASVCDPYLGKIPDARLARHYGISARVIARRRKKLGIAAAPRKGRGPDALLREYLRELERIG